MLKENELKIVLGRHPSVEPLRSGAITLSRAKLNFVEYTATHDAFKPMVNEQAFDICEMAVVTLLLAKVHGRPLHMLPAVLIGRLQQPFASVHVDVEMESPADLAGKRIGVRSFAQTTVTWLRGILKNDYGADLECAKWISFEDGHVPEVPDPTERAPEGKTLKGMLHDGEIDIALGLKPDDPRAKPLFPDPEKAAQDWYDRHGCLAINHVIAVTEEMVRNELEAIAEFWARLEEANEAAAKPKPMGFEAVRPSIELLIHYVNDLGLLPKPIGMDDLVDPRIMEVIKE